MIYLRLLWAFLQVGTFSFGGAYGAIPLIRDIVSSNGWLSDEMLAHIIALSESTPGPIMINMATYIGSTQAGLLGSIIATMGVVLPSFIVIMVIITLMKNLIKNRYVQAVMGGIKPCFIGIVFAMGIYMLTMNLIAPNGQITLDLRGILITTVLFAVTLIYRKFKKKELSPILLIILAAGVGVVVFTV